MNNDKNNQNSNGNDEIDLKELLLFALNKWYIFAIALFVSVSLMSVYYVTRSWQFKTTATILIRGNDATSFLSGGMEVGGISASDLLGGGSAVNDEIEVLKSKEMLRQAIIELDLRTSVFVKQRFRETETFHFSPLDIVYTEGYEQQIRGSISIEVKKNAAKNRYNIKVKRSLMGDKFTEKYTLNSLDEPLVTPWGEFRFVEHAERVADFDPDSDGSYTVCFQLSSVKSQIESLATEVSIALVSKKNNAILLSYQSSSPAKNEALLAKIIEIYNRNAVSEKNVVAVQMLGTIDDRLKIVEQELTAAENDLQRFCSVNDIADIEKQSQLLLEAIRDYEEQIATIDVQNSLITFLKDYLQNASDKDLIPSNTGINDPSLSLMFNEYNSLILKYMRIEQSTNESNPILEQLHRQIVLMRANIIKSIENAATNLAITKKDLQSQSKVYANEVDATPEKARQYLELRRKREIQQAFYVAMLQKREQMNVALATASEAARVIDPPYTLELRVSPKLFRLMFIALVLGGGLAVGIVFLIFLFSNKVSDKKDLRKLTSANYLGSVPLVKNAKLIADNRSLLAEAFRNIRTNLKFELKTPSDKVVMVTSSIAGEGKSLCSSNLALSVAALDKRVAIVGLDLRNPQLANNFSIRNSRGLSNYLLNESLSLDDIAISAPQNENLTIFVAGTALDNPSELINSPRLDQFFAQLREKFDFIVVDSAPVGIVADTMLLNNLVDVVIYVTRKDFTPREYVRNISELVSNGKLHNVSVILNAVPESQIHSYGYANRN